MNRRDLIKGLVAAPILLQVPSNRTDIITFAKNKKIITNVIDTDMELLGPDNVISWTNNIDHNLRTLPRLGYSENYDVQVGMRTSEGSISMYMTNENLAIVNQAIDGGRPLRMALPTEMSGILSTEFLAYISCLDVVCPGMNADIIVDMDFTVVGPPPQFYEAT